MLIPMSINFISPSHGFRCGRMESQCSGTRAGRECSVITVDRRRMARARSIRYTGVQWLANATERRV
jgi:hypothetical protein